MSPLVSVIIPAYNAERFISETIESVVNQTFSDFELLIVDDGSTDNQKKIIKEFAASDNRIRYIHQLNEGVSAARNNGFKNSCGQFIAFLDADDVWLPDNLALKINRFGSDEVGLVHSDAMVINEASEKIEGTICGIEGDLLDPLLLWDGTQIPGPSSILVKREVMEAIGVFDEKLSTAADKDFFIRVAAQYRIGRVSQVTWKYRLHRKNMHKNISVMEADILLLYQKARNSKLFHNKDFEKKCFSAMYLILAASWAGDGKNVRRSLIFVWQAVKINPPVILYVVKRLVNKWLLN